MLTRYFKLFPFFNYLFYFRDCLDLAEVMSVAQAVPTAGAPKKTDDKSFFDVSTLYILVSLKLLIYLKKKKTFCELLIITG